MIIKIRKGRIGFWRGLTQREMIGWWIQGRIWKWNWRDRREFDERIKPSHPTWSRSEKLESNPRVSTHEPSATTITAITAASTSSSSLSWFPAILVGCMKKKSQFFVYDESTVERKPRLWADWGISLVRTGDSNEDCERSPLIWFSRKYRLRNFCFVFIFHFNFVVRVSISNGVCIS